jgi:hypothetical protein
MQAFGRGLPGCWIGSAADLGLMRVLAGAVKRLQGSRFTRGRCRRCAAGGGA